MFPKQIKILLYFILLNTASPASTKKRYVADVETGALCPDNNQLEIPMRKFQIDRLNRTHKALTLDFTFAYPLDKYVESSVSIEKWSSGAWIHIHAFPFANDPCNRLMNLKRTVLIDLFVNIMRASGVKHPENCDIPAGNYTVVRYPLDISSDMPFLYERIKLGLTLRNVRTKKNMFCIVTVISYKFT